VDGLSRDNSWGLELDSGTQVSLDGSMTVDGVTEGVNNSSEETLTDGDIDDRSSSLDDIAFLNFSAHGGNSG